MKRRNFRFCELFPENEFVGVDLSEEMLAIAKKRTTELNIKNIHLQKDDMTKLSIFDDSSFDSVCSTLAMHHLPDYAALVEYFRSIKRVLKPQGQFFIADYRLMNKELAANYFAHKYESRQHPLLTKDLYNSLRAAFKKSDMVAALEEAEMPRSRIRSTFILPFMITIESNPNDQLLTTKQIHYLREAISKLDNDLKDDFKKLILFLQLGGYKFKQHL